MVSFPDMVYWYLRDSRSFRFQVATLGKLFTHMRLCHQAVKFGIGQRA